MKISPFSPSYNKKPALGMYSALAFFIDSAGVFGPGSSNAAAQPAVDVKSLHAKIGELTLENDFLEGALTKAGLLSAKR